MVWSLQELYKLTAQLEFMDGMCINLGIGMPTEVASYVPEGKTVTLQSENGMLGMGPFPTADEVDPDLINAGKQTITALAESSYFSSSESFAMIRGSHIDLTILGALEVSELGDLANWTIPGKMMKGMGGAMDLVANVKRVVIIMEFLTKDGRPKLVSQCALPLTGIHCVDRIYTDHGIFEFRAAKLFLIHKPDTITVEEITAKTSAHFTVDLNQI